MSWKCDNEWPKRRLARGVVVDPLAVAARFVSSFQRGPDVDVYVRIVAGQGNPDSWQRLTHGAAYLSAVFARPATR